MHDVDFIDLKRVPKEVESATKTLAANAVHLATILKGSKYPE